MLYRARYITPNNETRWLSVRALSESTARTLANMRKPFGWILEEIKHA